MTKSLKLKNYPKTSPAITQSMKIIEKNYKPRYNSINPSLMKSVEISQRNKKYGKKIEP
jgi:hypothetical protein